MNKSATLDKSGRLDDIKNFYKVFNKNNIDLLDEIYSSNIVFVDPFHHIEGINHLKDYFRNMAKNINYCHFDFKHEAVNNDDVFLQWRMTFSHPKIKSGTELEMNGVSHLVMNEKIVYHRDYFDSSEMLYKHIPVLGSVIRMIEKNLGG